ncbi:MAG: hypothetical protein JW923_08305 [Spirochaetales bacterium]|nr:hypothetical protein [Spirochaetales bacterium]
MKKYLALALLILAAGTALALDPRVLDASLTASMDYWDAAVPWIRLGSAPAVRAVDPSPILRGLYGDFSAVGRYEEFSYLISFVEDGLEDGWLEVRVVNDQPPSPGFWPARTGPKSAAIVISESDEKLLASDPNIYRSSFLRAAATLYFIEEEPSLSALYRGRNVLNEFSAFMSGCWVESIYLGEIRGLKGPSGPARNYIEFLVSSLVGDNLASVGKNLFFMNMDLAYSTINGVSDVDSAQAAVKLLEGFSGFYAAFETDLKRCVYGDRPGAYLLDRAFSARSVLVAVPWLELSIWRMAGRADTEVQDSLNNLQAELAELLDAYRYVDTFVSEWLIGAHNDLALRPPEPDAPAANSSQLAPAGMDSAVAGAASEEWYRYCVPESPFSLKGYLPLTREQAAEGTAYRLSMDAEGRLVAIDHYIHGRPQGGESLDWAARLAIERDGDTEVWRWINQAGGLATNQQGWSMMLTRPGSGVAETEYLFYSADGRRVRDVSGAWSVIRRTLQENSFEYEYRDASGRPFSAFLGYAVDRRIALTPDAELRVLLSDTGRPAFSSSWGYQKSLHTVTSETGRMHSRLEFFDTDGEPFDVLGAYASRVYFLSESERRVELLNRVGLPTDYGFGFSSEIAELDRGLVTSVRLFGPEGLARTGVDGYHSVEISLDARGLPVSSAFFDADGKPTSGLYGYHRRDDTYDERGFLVEAVFLDAEGKPATSELGAARIRWSLDDQGTPYWADAWDKNGALLSGQQPGEL